MRGREPAGEPGDHGRNRGRLPAFREGALAFGHLAVLSTFALAQPLFDLLSDNPEFFAARGSTPAEIIVFAVLLVLVPPLVLLGIEVLVGFAGPRARRSAHLALMGTLASVVFVQALKKALGASDPVLIVLALALGAIAALAYARAGPVRSFMSVLTVAPLVFLGLFLFISPVSPITLGGEAKAQSVGKVARVPVVMVVFDELPTGSLLDAQRSVDAKRYPGFAALARDATWFRNAHTVYDSTSRAIPALLDGTYPEKGQLPTAAEHPNALFALLGNSHRMNVSEEATSLCPRNVCKDPRLDKPLVSRLGSMASDLGLVYAHVVSPPDLEEGLPSVSQTWGGFGGGEGESKGTGKGTAKTKPKSEKRKPGAGARGSSTLAVGPGPDGPEPKPSLNGNRRERFEGWRAAIERGDRPTLNFKHTLLPHAPWQYLPDGRLYRDEATDPIANLTSQAYTDTGQANQPQLRHLLQCGFADFELRKVIARLKATGTYDETLIVVAADHGVAVQDDSFDRRKVTRDNIAEISPVPLFVKKPRQTAARIDESIVETTDVVPTILDVLGIDKPKGMDGYSAFGEEVKARDEVRMFTRTLEDVIRVPGPVFEAERLAVLQEKIRIFGEGADGPDRLYRVGPNQELIGRETAGLDTGEESAARADLVDADAYADVDTSGRLLPIWVVGRVAGGEGSKRDIALAVNGKVRAVGNTFELASGNDEIFAVFVPPSSLRNGANDIELFEVGGGGSELRSMGGT